MTTVSENKLSRTLCGISGEYFVAAELSRNGFIAAVTLRNTRGTDIIVSRPGKSAAATIQVKTMQASGKTHWMLTEADEECKGPNHYYVFVALNGKTGHPDYYVVEGDTVATTIRKEHQEWVKGKKKDGSPRKDTARRAYWPKTDSKSDWKRIAV